MIQVWFKKTKILLGLALVGLVTLHFNIGNSVVLAAQVQPVLASPNVPLSPLPTLIRTVTARPPTSSPTATLVSGVLSCNTVAPGVTCTDYGTYLDYNIDISVSGLTGGATAGYIFIGTYQRTTNGGEMGMTSSFIHCETSGYVSNTVSSAVHIQPFDASGIWYPWFTNDTGGTSVCVKNNVANDWRYIPGSGGWPNGLAVRGDVNWPITGYSIVGHIYLYSNQNFMTVTPTATKTSTSTITPTATITSTPTQQVRWYTGNSQGGACGVRAHISTPLQALHILESGESSYVTTTNQLFWIQTGWRYYKWYDFPLGYVEVCAVNSCPPAINYAPQLWGESVEYRVEWVTGTVWCAFISNVEMGCGNTGTSVPHDVNAHSEVHINPQNELNSYFSDVYYRNSNDQWILFEQSRWREDIPYSVEKIHNHEFRNYGP